jgi:ketosteroid isomerase-like protein
MEANNNVQEAIISLLNKYGQAYSDKDIEGMLKLFIPDDDLVVIGTGFDEWIKGSEELQSGFKRDMNQADTINVKFRNLTISNNGKVAWLSCHMNMEATVDGKDIYLPGRLSAVFEERNGEWLFAHAHYSLPAEDQEEGKAWPESD